MTSNIKWYSRIPGTFTTRVEGKLYSKDGNNKQVIVNFPNKFKDIFIEALAKAVDL